MTLSVSEVQALKHAPAVEGVLPVFHERWSSRAFANREVSDADLKRVFEAARWAPSAYNEQPWRFLVGKTGSETYRKIFSTLIGFNQEWAGSAPVLILGVSSSKFSHNGTENSYALYDLGAASAQLVLQAAALGLTTHQMAGFDHGKAREVFDIPEEFVPGAVIALGYQGDPTVLANEKLLEMETSPRERKPLEETVFSSWGTGAKLGS